MIDTVAALSHPIPLEPVEQAQVVSGTPLVGVVTLGMIGDKEYGVWEMSPGSMSDVETDEVCVILAGAATVEFIDQERTVELLPGTVLRLDSGSRTIWTVTETLRKVWVA